MMIINVYLAEKVAITILTQVPDNGAVIEGGHIVLRNSNWNSAACFDKKRTCVAE